MTRKLAPTWNVRYTPTSTPNLTNATLYFGLPKSQINRLKQIQNMHVLSLKLRNLLISHPSSDLCTGSRLMNALNINSLTYKVLTTS